MSAVNNQSNSTSDKKSIFIIGGVILIGALTLFAYLMWYVSPDEYIESDSNYRIWVYCRNF